MGTSAANASKSNKAMLHKRVTVGFAEQRCCTSVVQLVAQSAPLRMPLGVAARQPVLPSWLPTGTSLATTHHHVLPVNLRGRQPQLHSCLLLALQGRDGAAGWHECASRDGQRNASFTLLRGSP